MWWGSRADIVSSWRTACRPSGSCRSVCDVLALRAAPKLGPRNPPCPLQALSAEEFAAVKSACEKLLEKGQRLNLKAVVRAG